MRAFETSASPSIRAVSWLSILLLVGMGHLACTRQTSEPPRPTGVPTDAMWIGGVDGGVFLRLEKRPDDPSATYRARVYADSSGDLIFEGVLTMIPGNHSQIDIDDPRTFSGWDGESLYLADGARLSALPEGDEPSRP